MLSLQKLQQNIASMQQQSTMPSMAGLQGLGGLSAASLNSPLNLSVAGAIPSSACSTPGGLNLNPTQMPQLILASGQLVQGIQGAQLLIPTSQGVATQTILTIPVSQQINSNEHLVQGLGMNSGSVSPNSGLLSPHILSASVQQLLSAIQPQMFQQQQPPQSLSSSSSSSGSSQQAPLNVQQSRVHTPKSSPPRNASASSISSIGSSQHHESRHHMYEKSTLPSPSIATTTATSTSQSQGTPHYTTNGHSQISTSPHHIHHSLSNRGHSPTSLALNNINR